MPEPCFNLIVTIIGINYSFGIKNKQEIPMDIGLPKEDRKIIADALSDVLADTFILYLKTHSFHWNIREPNFFSLHALFKDLYEDLIEGGDSIAERIRALGYRAPGSYSEFLSLSVLKDESSPITEAPDMIRQLLFDNELVVRRLKETYETADARKDLSTGDLMVQRMNIHAKAAWMLRSHIE
jgi:starvation-inducible DNA-binding protein